MSDAEINPDVFTYAAPAGTTPMKQCISGFGHSFKMAIDETLEQDPDEYDTPEARADLAWHVDELVRWCQQFNGETQRLTRELAAAINQRDAFERGLHQLRTQAAAVDQPPRPLLDLASIDGDVVLSAAVRYALGRQTYVPSSVIAAVRLAMPTMTPGRRQPIARDIREAEQRGGLGDLNIDAPAWLTLATDLEAT